MGLKAAFMFIAPQANPQTHRNTVTTAEVEVTTVAVQSYEQACLTAKTLVDQGCVAIELCGGFGIEGVAAVNRAVEGRAVVGVVRFDHHPGLDHRSGDQVFEL
jgi:hypothetical protein